MPSCVQVLEECQKVVAEPMAVAAYKTTGTRHTATGRSVQLAYLRSMALITLSC